MSERTAITLAGGVSNVGAFNMISYSGLEDIDAFLELIDNSIDWRHDDRILNIMFVVTNSDELLIIDNAMGMTLDKFKKMFILYNQDLDGPSGRSGICGYGTKAALKKLCSYEHSEHTIITKHNDDAYYTQQTDWCNVTTMDKAFPIYDSTSEEIKLFKTYNKDNSGTIIKIKLTRELSDIIDLQFQNKNMEKLITNDESYQSVLKLNKYFSAVYNNHNDVAIKYIYKNKDPIVLKYYDIFNQPSDNYLFGIDGKQSIIIRVKYNVKTREELVYIVHNNEYYYIHKRRMNCLKKPSGPHNSLPSFDTNENVVKMEFEQHLCCLKPNTTYFDIDNPKIPSDTGLTLRDTYRIDFYGEKRRNDEINSKMMICRKDTIIGNINIGSIATAGGKSDEKFEKIHISTQLDYTATSNQKDATDDYMNTHKNKHQYEKSDSRKALWRMCEYNRKMFSHKLWRGISDETQTYNTRQTNAANTIIQYYRKYKKRQEPTVVPAVPVVPTVVPKVPAVPTVVPKVPAVPTVVPTVVPAVPKVPKVPKVVPTHNQKTIVKLNHDEIQIKRIRILTKDVSLDTETRYALNWMLEQYEIKCNEIL